MTVKQIEQLIEKYFQAETTREEERLLRHWFSNQHPLPPHLAAYRPWFAMLETESKRTTSDDFAERLQKKLQSAPRTGRIAPMWVARLSRVAAAAALLAIAYFAAHTWQTQLTPHSQSAIVLAEGEIDDPVLAYQQTMAALEFLTDRMEASRRQAVKSIQHVAVIERVLKTDR